MPNPIILASGSSIRRDLLENAGVTFTTQVARVDEDSMRRSLEQEEATPRDIADALAEMKALRVSQSNPGATVIGCDQVLNFKGQILSKPKDIDEAREHLLMLRGERHVLLSAVVVYEAGTPLWRTIGTTRLHMRLFSDGYLEQYLLRNWGSIRHSVGGYKLEEEGARLMTRVEGDYFNVLGLPLLDLLSFLARHGSITE